MDNNFSVFDSPFSNETKKMRLNSLLASGLCLFIGLTEKLPAKFSLLGISFSSDQKIILGWFIFSVTLYLFVHFLSAASIEFAKWVHPFWVDVRTKRGLLKHPAFDETDFMDIPGPFDEHDKYDLERKFRVGAEWHVKKRLNYVYRLIYLKLTLEVLMPLVIGVFGLLKLLQLLTMDSGATGTGFIFTA